MKKLILLTIGISLLLGSCTSSNKKNGWSEEKLFGKVKSYKESVLKGTGTFSSKTIKFNQEGYIIEKKFYGFNNKLYNVELYDSKGIQIRRDDYNIDGYKEEIHYKFDNNGNNVQISNNTPNYPNVIYMKYNDKGHMVEKLEHRLYNEEKLKSTYKYDDKGNKIEENIYNAEGDFFTKTYKYDSKNNMIEENDYYSDGSLHSKIIVEYDNNGNIINESKYFSSGKLFCESRYKYDDKGNLVELIVDNNEFLKRRNGVVINAIEKYEYDEKGNWIKKIEYINGQSGFNKEREIEYFD